MDYPAWAEAFCFECGDIEKIVAILGRRRAPVSKLSAWYVAVRLLCGHERHAKEKVVMTPKALRKLELLLAITKLKLQTEEARALAVNT